MHGYNTIETQNNYLRYIYIVEPSVHYKLLVEHSYIVLQTLIIIQTIIPVISIW